MVIKWGRYFVAHDIAQYSAQHAGQNAHHAKTQSVEPLCEGPQQAKTPEDASTTGGRVLWVMICTVLWPFMVLTGLNSVRLLAKRKRKATVPVTMDAPNDFRV